MRCFRNVQNTLRHQTKSDYKANVKKAQLVTVPI